MKSNLLFILSFVSVTLVAQTKVTVTVSNGSFNPSNITITTGDTVEFVNVLGTHWVDGRQATFSSNPASFDNQSQSGTGWTYDQVFTVAGSYDYRCGIHTTTMFGAITVQSPAGLAEQAKAKGMVFYPNPASGNLFFSKYNHVEKVVIYNVTGEKVLETVLFSDNIDISSLQPGAYFVKIKADNEQLTKKLIIQ